jgi:hypothetical protein
LPTTGSLTTTASWCVDGVCGNGIETLTCTLCPATNGTRSAGLSCLGTQGLEFNDLGDEYEVGDNRNLGIVQVCIPDYHNSKPVVGISYSAIGDEGVGCEIIESIRIGANVTYIGGSAFECCTNLETVIFAEGSQLETISGWAFALTAITSITIPAGVTSIGGAAFQGCTSLETVTVLATTPPEMGWAFYQCCCDGGGILPSLTAIRVPAGSVDAYKAHPAWEEFEHLIVAIP